MDTSEAPAPGEFGSVSHLPELSFYLDGTVTSFCVRQLLLLKVLNLTKLQSIY